MLRLCSYNTHTHNCTYTPTCSLLRSTPIPWKSPGGWDDCDPANTWTLALPDAPPEAAGLTNVSLALPAALLKAWLADEQQGLRLGQGNAGLLIRWGSQQHCTLKFTVEDGRVT